MRKKDAFFDFEVPYFTKYGLDTVAVGHPIADNLIGRYKCAEKSDGEKLLGQDLISFVEKTISNEESAESMYESIDLLADKLDRQVKKFKNKALYSDKTSIRNVEDVVETEDEAVLEDTEVLEDIEDDLDDDMDDLTILGEEELEDEENE